MNYAAHLWAAIPTPCRILGIKLRPLCTGHLVILEHQNSPLSSSEKAEVILANTEKFDIIFAVEICSRTFEEGVAFLDDPDSSKAALKAAPKDWDLSEKFKLIHDYIAEGSKVLDTWTLEGSEGQSIGAHSSETIVALGMMKLGLSESQALNMPMMRLQRLIAAAWEVQLGKQIIVSDADREAAKLAEKLGQRVHNRAFMEAVCRN